MYVRGPKITPNSTFELPGSNADFAPTWLGLAGIANADMDGSSIVPHLLSTSNDAGDSGADDGRQTNRSLATISQTNDPKQPTFPH